MPRIRPLDDRDLPSPSRAVLEKHVADHGSVTNMKRTLAHSHGHLCGVHDTNPLRRRNRKKNFNGRAGRGQVIDDVYDSTTGLERAGQTTDDRYR